MRLQHSLRGGDDGLDVYGQRRGTRRGLVAPFRLRRAGLGASGRLPGRWRGGQPQGLLQVQLSGIPLRHSAGGTRVRAVGCGSFLARHVHPETGPSNTAWAEREMGQQEQWDTGTSIRSRHRNGAWGTVRCARVCEKQAIFDPFSPTAKVTITTVSPYAGLLRFLLGPKSKIMSQTNLQPPALRRQHKKFQNLTETTPTVALTRALFARAMGRHKR